MANSSGNVIKKRPHTYTTSEQATIADAIADTLDAQDSLDREKQIFNQDIKRREKELNDKLQTLRSNKKQGYEVREYECAVVRTRDTRMVEYIDVKSGEVIVSHPFTQEDWDIVLDQSQLSMFPDTAPDENDIRSAAPPRLFPNADENGTVVAGPATDLYNQTYPGSPYKHLSENIDFAPALTSLGIDGIDAETQVLYNNVINIVQGATLAKLREMLPVYQADSIEGKDLDETGKRVRDIIVEYTTQRIAILEAIEASQQPTSEPVGEEAAEGHAADDGAEVAADSPAEGEQAADDTDAPSSDAPSDEEGGEEAGDEAAPKKPKNTPKRPAARKKK